MTTESPEKTGIRAWPGMLLRIVQRLISIPVQFLAQRDQLWRIEYEARQLGAAAVESSTYAATELRQVSERMGEVDERLAALEREVAELRRVLALERDEIARPPSS